MGMFGDRAKVFLAALADPSLGVALGKKQDKQRQDAVLQQAAMMAAGLLGPAQGAMRQAPVANDEGEDITAAFAPQMEQGPSRQRSPQEIAQGLAALAARTPGFNPKPYVDLAQYSRPNLMVTPSGEAIDQYDPSNAGRVFPKMGEGIAIGPRGAAAVPGYADANASIEGAKTKAQEGAKAALDVISVNMPDGSTQQIPRDVAVQAILQSLVPGGGEGGGGTGLGRSQTPAAASSAKIAGDARANAQVTLPSDLNGIDTAIDTAKSLRDHPALDRRTGLWSVLPAVPGTPGAAFEAYKQQVLGQGFLSARQALKGGGQITDFEGSKAEQAIIRAKAAQTPEDFKAAISDYIGSLERARGVLQKNAGGAPAGQGPGPRTSGFRSRIVAVGE